MGLWWRSRRRSLTSHHKNLLTVLLFPCSDDDDSFFFQSSSSLLQLFHQSHHPKEFHVWGSESNPMMQGSHLRVNGPHFVNASSIIRLIVSNKQTAMSHNDEYFSPISYQNFQLFAPALRRASTDDPKYITFAKKTAACTHKFILPQRFSCHTWVSYFLYTIDMRSKDIKCFDLNILYIHWPVNDISLVILSMSLNSPF